ncbi:MAG: DUF3606 domain-containing protein [Sphingobium sp.]|nr:DUF3606 domain-containing protein [Sphingobium sp.]
MSDDKTYTDGLDRQLISMEEDYEVEYWTDALGVSKAQLQHAVDQVGNSVDAVRSFLGRSN